MASEQRRPRRIHRSGISSQQRIHLAAVLIAFCALPLAAQDDISFDPDITQEQFHTFSALVGQAIFPTPVNPGDSGGFLGFDIGLAITAVPIDENAAYWTKSVDSDLLQSGYLAVPRIIVSKGLGLGNLSASYAEIPDTDVKMLGGAFDLPLIRGNVLKPTLVLRGTYAQLQGIDEFQLTTYGGEAVLGKGFGNITPYVAAGIAHVESEGHITVPIPENPDLIFTDDFQKERYTAGLRISLLILKIVVEATQAEERTYAAKVSFGL
jgi:hypothetical protein